MKSPKPPPAISVAMAAMPVVSSAETRIPVMITGQARGSSTLNNRSVLDMPMPLADSRTSGLTLFSPVTVLRMIGNRAYSNKATKLGANPRPSTGMNRVNRAREGMVMKTLVVPSATSLATGRRLTSTPTATAMMVAVMVTVTT